MNDTKIKACPFCGSQAGQPEDCSVKNPDGTVNPKYGPWWQIMCLNLECRAWRAAASPAEVVSIWNKRAGAREPNATKTPAVSTLASAMCSTATVKYYLVTPAVDGVPLAMFQYKEWAEEWKARYCATATIEEFDMIIKK